ncbi:hypothetical protein AK812_SmicGene23257 [Symbiodinium microadriaticum]|uniref:Uncharacterized protein n=1 Tax=Symbiodinium microadriaticum TaxID=2951 RepID=A0A1Q9DHN4_SYMMI|nr:hypothetical protein AK812_SmicGene23257 [Symbiodinium microadriaticum]
MHLSESDIHTFQNAFLQPKDWGAGERPYSHAAQLSKQSARLHADFERLQILAARVFVALQGLNGCVGSPSLRQASHRCRGSARRLETAVAAVRKSVQPEDSGDLEEVWTGLGSFLTIRRWHWAAAAAAANVTRGASS